MEIIQLEKGTREQTDLAVYVEELREPLEIILEFVERWNKKDEEVAVAEAAGKLLAILGEAWEKPSQLPPDHFLSKEGIQRTMDKFPSIRKTVK